MRRALVLVGGACCTLGVAVGLGTTLALPGGTLLVVAIVCCLGLMGVALGVDSVGQRRRTAGTPPVETRQGVRTPGGDVDRLLAGEGDPEEFARLRTRILAEASARRARRTGQEPDTETLAATTSDPLVAAYCRGEPATRRERMRALLAGESVEGRRARRAIDDLLESEES